MESVNAGLGPQYHESQQGALCLKHAINNLLQTPHFSKQELDTIAKTLPRQGCRVLNPHKCLFFGNYDVNVMMVAFDTLNKDIQWHDERDVDFRKTKLEKCWGLIVNCKGHGQWVSMVANSRHWYGIRKFKDCWFSLDSASPFPQQITGTQEAGCESELKDYLRRLKARDPTTQIFLITEKEACK